MDWQKLHNTSTPQERVEILLHIAHIVERHQYQLVTIKGRIVRAHTHWLGNAHRPRRLERALIFTVTLGALPVLEFDQYLLWCAAWGGGAAVFINLCAAFKIIPRRRYHWAGT